LSKPNRFLPAGATRLRGALGVLVNRGFTGSRRGVAADIAGGATLRRRVFRAGGWTLFAHLISLLLRLIATVITTRLFTPQIFGVLAIATAVNVVVTLLTDIGLRQAVIRSPNGSNARFLHTAWTLQILSGWLVWSVCAVAAAGVYVSDLWGWIHADSVYAAPNLPAIVLVTAFNSVILGFQSMKAVIVNRDLDLKHLTLIDLMAQLGGLAITITLGYLTRSIWSFVIGNLIFSILTTVLSHVWLSGPRDRLAWDRSAIHELAHFGKWAILSSIFTALAGNGDRLMLGGWVNATAMGYYSLASNLVTVAEGIAGRLYVSVSLPALSEVVRNQPDRLGVLYSRLRWFIDTGFVGFAGFLFATAQWIVALLYDPRYAPAGPLLQWLSFSLLFTRYRFGQSAYLALGHPSYLTTINFVKLVSLMLLVPAFYYAFGFQGAIIGIAFHLAPTLPFVFWFNRRHGLNNLSLEAATIAMWPVGWLIGRALIYIVTP
jgi:O-antigen/teichoic acid export membrane protein